MKKDLPDVYANPFTKKINNTQELYYGNNKVLERKDVGSVLNKINNIFSSNNHIYKSKVRITLKDEVITTDIVGKSNGHLLTMDGKNIKIIDIIDIEKI